MYQIQFKTKGQSWTNDANFEASTDRQSLATQVLVLAKANLGTQFRVLSPAKPKKS